MIVVVYVDVWRSVFVIVLLKVTGGPETVMYCGGPGTVTSLEVVMNCVVVHVWQSQRRFGSETSRIRYRG